MGSTYFNCLAETQRTIPQRCQKPQPDNKSHGQFYGCFQYDWKGEHHYYYPETEHEKKKNKELLDKENEDEGPLDMLSFVAVERLKDIDNESRGRKRPGRKAKYDNNKKLKTRGDRSKGGVDWLRHRDGPVKNCILPLCNKLKEEGIYPIVVEDGASCHKFQWVLKAYQEAGIKRFGGLMIDNETLDPWPPYSLDLNAHEQFFSWARKEFHKDGLFMRTDEEIERNWVDAWKRCLQDNIWAWIDHLAEVVDLIIEHGGDNDFHS